MDKLGVKLREPEHRQSWGLRAKAILNFGVLKKQLYLISFEIFRWFAEKFYQRLPPLVMVCQHPSDHALKTNIATTETLDSNITRKRKSRTTRKVKRFLCMLLLTRWTSTKSNGVLKSFVPNSMCKICPPFLGHQPS